jgi:type IV secretion system protein VirD4
MSIIYDTAGFFFKKWLLTNKTGAKWAPKKEIKKYLNSSNSGLLIDGQDLRLSEKESFQNLCLVSRIGTGKTARYIIPNVLDKAGANASLVVNDPKGEVYAATSGLMHAQGFKVIVIDPENIGRSSCFNPLWEAQTEIELEQLAEIIGKCGSTSTGKDQFWVNGSVRLLKALLKLLRNYAAHHDHRAFNLASLQYLLQNFGQRGEGLEEWIGKASVIPNAPYDRSLLNEWTGALQGNKQGVLSFVLNAVTALDMLTNKNVARLTAKSDFKLSDLRRQKTIIYFITPPQLAEYYGFLTSVFFRSVFNACMREMPGRGTLPVYILYDEFGHSTIPHFVSVANTIRAYNVSLSIVLQSVAQLNARYGEDYAQSMMGGFNTFMTYHASDSETCEMFSKLAGTVRERQQPDIGKPTVESYQEYRLITSNEVRTIPEGTAIIISGNRNPAHIPAQLYFQVKSMAKKASYRPFAPVTTGARMPRLNFLQEKRRSNSQGRSRQR